MGYPIPTTAMVAFAGLALFACTAGEADVRGEPADASITVTDPPMPTTNPNSPSTATPTVAATPTGTATADQRPPIDHEAPATFQTATFALG